MKAGGCKFWAWYDDEPTPFLRQVVLDLRDTVRALRKENHELRALRNQNNEQDLSVAESRHGERDVAVVGLAGRVAQLEKERRLFFVLLVVFVMMLVRVLIRECN